MQNYALRKIFSVTLLTCLCLTGWSFAAAETLPGTPPDYEGPFYPVTRQQDEDNNLVEVKGREGTARGEVLNLSGIILDKEGKPREGVTIEIWQTDRNGRYLHPGDASPGERDPNFQYWGRDTTDADGRFTFRTLLPGAYNPRPAHIHYKLWQGGKNVLTSQIYFRKPSKGERLPSMTTRFDSQTAGLKATPTGEYETFYKIVF